MTTATKFVIYLVVLHLLAGALIWITLADNWAWFLAAEAVLLLSAYLGYRFYRGLVAPLRLLGRGAAALADRDFSVRLVETGSGEMDRLVRVYNQMIDQLRAERVVARQREEFLDRLVASARLGVAVLDFDGGVASVNDWLRERRRDEAFDAAVFQPALLPRPRQNPEPVILTGPDNRRYRAESGTFRDRGFARRFLVIQDVSAELLGVEKTAYGKVIRMMAHEVNNSTGAVTSVLQSLHGAATVADNQLPELCTEYLPIVTERMSNLTRFMRRFADVIRLPTPEPAPVDLNDLLRRTGELLRPALEEDDIRLTYALHPTPVRISGDRALLEQVVVNALANARESIGRGGAIELSTNGAPRGFTVADDGPGLGAEQAALLFTPFYSSKPTGQGVGLTLTRDILEGHGARYALTTDADGWTRLRVTF